MHGKNFINEVYDPTSGYRVIIMTTANSNIVGTASYTTSNVKRLAHRGSIGLSNDKPIYFFTFNCFLKITI